MLKKPGLDAVLKAPLGGLHSFPSRRTTQSTCPFRQPLDREQHLPLHHKVCRLPKRGPGNARAYARWWSGTKPGNQTRVIRVDRLQNKSPTSLAAFSALQNSFPVVGHHHDERLG